MPKHTLTFLRLFRNETYVIVLHISNGCLNIFVTRKTTGEKWYGHFDAAIIEQITERGGHKKQFGSFLSLIISGLKNSKSLISFEWVSDKEIKGKDRSKKLKERKGKSKLPKFYVAMRYKMNKKIITYYLRMEQCRPSNDHFLRCKVRDLKNDIELLREKLERLSHESYKMQLVKHALSKTSIEHEMLKRSCNCLMKILNNVKASSSTSSMQSTNW